MILVILLSARFCLGRWGFGRIGLATGQDAETSQIKIQPNPCPDHHCHRVLVLCLWRLKSAVCGSHQWCGSDDTCKEVSGRFYLPLMQLAAQMERQSIAATKTAQGASIP